MKFHPLNSFSYNATKARLEDKEGVKVNIWNWYYENNKQLSIPFMSFQFGRNLLCHPLPCGHRFLAYNTIHTYIGIVKKVPG